MVREADNEEKVRVPRSKDAWVSLEVPALRIVDDEVWAAMLLPSPVRPRAIFLTRDTPELATHGS